MAQNALKLVVLVSGSGSNLRAIHQAIQTRTCHAHILGIIADRKRCSALGWAEENNIPTQVVRPRDHDSREAWDRALTHALRALEPDLVVLAGFMRLVGPLFLANFGGRTINVHPSLLPAFTGLNAPQQAIDAKVRLSGCTVHLVDSGVDTGPILAQAAVPVCDQDDADSLHARIQRVEHRLFPQVIHWIANGDMKLEPTPCFIRAPRTLDHAFIAPALDTP